MRMRRSTATVSGLVIMVLGIWGALIAFVGPYFDYAFGVNKTWHYTTDRLWLNILPGALALAGGILLAFSARRAALVRGALAAIIAGSWFVVGPAVSLTWETGVGPIGRPLFGSTRQMLELVGYFYGLGALIVAFAAFSLGRVWSLSRVARTEPAAVATATGSAADREPERAAWEPAEQDPSAAEPAAASPRSRIGILRGRRRGGRSRDGRGTPAGRQR